MHFRPKQNKAGFTIVELLIVIVVIGILAAITIVAYNGIQDRTNDASVKSDLTALMKKFELYKVDKGTYPPSDTELNTLGLRVNKKAYLVAPDTTYNLVPCLKPDDKSVAIAAISKSGNRFYITSDSGGVKQFTGSTSWTGTDGYYVPCNDVFYGSGIGEGSCNAIGFCASWRTWLNN